MKNADVGRYSISSDGVVVNTETGRVLKQKIDKEGYKSVCLYLAEGKKYKRVHRLVAQVHIDNINNFPVINHKNGVKTDNRSENLEWCTQSHNIKHSFDSGFQKPTILMGHNHGMYKGVILATSKDGDSKIYIRALTDCYKYGFNSGHVSSCINGNLNAHKGFTFMRINDEN